QLVREQLQAGHALYTLDLEMLQALQPELIVTQTLCDVCAVAESEVLAAVRTLPGPPRVLNLEPMSLDEVFATLLQVGEAAGRPGGGAEVVAGLRDRVRQVAERTATIPPEQRPRVAFLEWLDPLFNGGHWNPALIELAGGVDVLGNAGQPSRTVPWSAL